MDKLKTFKESIIVENHCKVIVVPDFSCHHMNFLEYVQDQLDVYNELQHLRNTKILGIPWEPQVQMLLTYTATDKYPAGVKLFERYKKEE